jgi:hypothetical protein
MDLANRRNLTTENTVNASNWRNPLQIDGENPVRLREAGLLRIVINEKEAVSKSLN